MLLNNPGLRILVFKTQGHRAWLSPEMLIEALTCCPNLKELTLATELAPSFYTTARAGSGSGMGGSGTGNGMSQWGEKTSRTAGDDDDVSLPPMNHGLQKLTVRSEYDQRLDSLLAQCPRLEQLAILSLNTLAARDLCNQLCSPSFSTLLQSSSPSSTSSVSAPSYYSSFSRLSKLELGSGQYQHKVLAALTDCTEQSLPALHSLTLHYPSDRAIQAIANDSHMVHRLEHLDIRLGFDPCNGLVDLLKRCQGLKRLSITAQGNPSFIDIARLLPITDSKVSIMNRAGGSSTTTMTTLEKKVAATTSKSTWACLQLEELQLSVGLLCPHRMKEGLLTQWQRIGNVEQEVAVNHEKSRDKEDHDQGACQENVRDVEEDAFQISHVSLVTHGGCTCLDCAKAETRLMRQLGCLTQLRRLEIVQPSRLAMQPGQQDLSWRLDRGLGYLAGLSQLREVDLGQSTAFLGGVEELRWMKKHWVALRRLVCAKVYYETSRFWLCAQWPELRVVELAC
ncbi:hypothetical protein BGZ73_005067 [Actinomortierella ambigua]|nr:hypothetical protein BGZ73_005067 [Actinomortierella ambigua]